MTRSNSSVTSISHEVAVSPVVAEPEELAKLAQYVLTNGFCYQRNGIVLREDRPERLE